MGRSDALRKYLFENFRMVPETHTAPTPKQIRIIPPNSNASTLHLVSSVYEDTRKRLHPVLRTNITSVEVIGLSKSSKTLIERHQK